MEVTAGKVKRKYYYRNHIELIKCLVFKSIGHYTCFISCPDGIERHYDDQTVTNMNYKDKNRFSKTAYIFLFNQRESTMNLVRSSPIANNETQEDFLSDSK